MNEETDLRNRFSPLAPHPSSFPPCRLIMDPPTSGAWNMAADEWLLRRAAAGAECCLRLYRWAEPTLSLGYFQSADDRFQDAHLSGAAVVRRISGGGAILHDRELTYCMVVPAAHPLTRSRQAMYRAVHGSIVDTLGEMGIAASLCEETSSGATAQPFLCFQRRLAGDVLVGETKVAGSANGGFRGPSSSTAAFCWPSPHLRPSCRASKTSRQQPSRKSK